MMEAANQFGKMAALFGDKSRAIMLWRLLDGRACTPTELSHFANISAQSASNHLSKLAEAQILRVEFHGRHRYYTFANEDVAHVVESMASLITIKPAARKLIENAGGITYARTCYDHLAGKLGVDVTVALIRKGMIKQSGNKYAVTGNGKVWFQLLGIDIELLRTAKRAFARPCLDWSERRHHLAGAVGAAFLDHLIEDDWIRRVRNSREVVVTAKGRKELDKKLGIDVQ